MVTATTRTSKPSAMPMIQLSQVIAVNRQRENESAEAETQCVCEREEA